MASAKLYVMLRLLKIRITQEVLIMGIVKGKIMLNSDESQISECALHE